LLIELYLFFSAIAVFLFVYTFFERHWIPALVNVPFISILIPSSFKIEKLHATHLLVNATTGEVQFFQNVAVYHDAWVLGVMWGVFLFVDVALILLFYSTGELTDMIKTLRRSR